LVGRGGGIGWVVGGGCGGSGGMDRGDEGREMVGAVGDGLVWGGVRRDTGGGGGVFRGKTSALMIRPPPF
jgi:hypothetical protein